MREIWSALRAVPHSGPEAIGRTVVVDLQRSIERSAREAAGRSIICPQLWINQPRQEWRFTPVAFYILLTRRHARWWREERELNPRLVFCAFAAMGIAIGVSTSAVLAGWGFLAGLLLYSMSGSVALVTLALILPEPRAERVPVRSAKQPLAWSQVQST